jgi:peptide/nickel transport system permease protein
VIAQVREKFGLDKPLPVQYWRYITNVLRGDLGTSFTTKHSVSADLRAFFPATLELVLVSWLIALAVGIPVGILAAVRADSGWDHASRLLGLMGVSTPLFWLGVLFQVVFYRELGWLPLQGRLSSETALLNPISAITGLHLLDSALTGNWAAFRDALAHICLPSFTLAFAALGLVMRMTRSCMIEVLSKDYITTATAYGLSSWRILFVYALKNALIPIITIVALAMGNSLMGSILVESVFDWPGIGQYAVRAILGADFAPVMGVTLLVGVAYTLLNLAVDILYAFIDPRITLAKVDH